MASIQFWINGATTTIDADPQMPLLWAIRDLVGLKGTKFGCGIAQCGACTLYVDGNPVRSCSYPVIAANGKKLTTIEGLSTPIEKAVQDAWIELQVPQCGYCQSGQIMTAASLLKRNAKPTDADIDAAMQSHLCRCGTYLRIKAAIHLAAKKVQAL